MSERLLPIVDRLLDGAGWKKTDLEAVGFVDGPGSFTGLRIGLSTALGLQAGLGLKLAAAGTFESLAETASGQGKPVICLEDARIGQFYAALYDAAGTPDSRLPEGAYPEATVRRFIAPDVLRAGRGWNSRNGAVFGPLPADIDAPGIAAIARIIHRKAGAGAWSGPDSVRPRYLGISPVEAK